MKEIRFWLGIILVPLVAAVAAAGLQVYLNEQKIEDLRSGQEQLILLHLKE